MPIHICLPPIAKIKNTNTKTIVVSPKCEIEANKAVTNFLRPLNLFTVFKGRKIRNALKPASPEIFVPFITLSKMKEIQPTKTTEKSKIFQ